MALSRAGAPYAEARAFQTLTIAKSAPKWRRTATVAPRLLIWALQKLIYGTNARSMVSANANDFNEWNKCQVTIFKLLSQHHQHDGAENEAKTRKKFLRV